MKRFAMAIHGGAGTLSREVMTDELAHTHKIKLREALESGLRILQQGGSSLDAVEWAVVELENCPLFNAGKGSVFSYEGKHEMDAAIMDGSTLAAGAIGNIRVVKNPIRLARAVLDKAEYVLLCGDQALQFAREQRLPFATPDYFHTAFRYDDWLKLRNGAPETVKKMGTVGAVALDSRGCLAAATSTGGLVNKRYGRIGDSCIIGAGTYANNSTCAVSCTGDGEQFIRAAVAHDISSMIEYQQLPLSEACSRALEKVSKLGGSGGLIALHRSGLIEMPFTTEGMYRACCHPNGNMEIRIFR